MKHFETRFLADGPVVIPDEIKNRLSLKDGDKIDFYLDRNGCSVSLIARNGKISSIKGLFKHSGPPIDDDEEIMNSLAEKHERINREWAEWHAFQEWRKSRPADAAE